MSTGLVVTIVVCVIGVSLWLLSISEPVKAASESPKKPKPISSHQAMKDRNAAINSRPRVRISTEEAQLVLAAWDDNLPLPGCLSCHREFGHRGNHEWGASASQCRDEDRTGAEAFKRSMISLARPEEERRAEEAESERVRQAKHDARLESARLRSGATES